MLVVLADDEPKVCSAIRLLLNQELGISNIQQIEHADILLETLERQPADMLLLDWELPGFRSDLLAKLRAGWPAMRVVVLSGHPDVEQHALRAGATAFISKTSPPETLLTCLARLLPAGSLYSRPQNTV